MVRAAPPIKSIKILPNEVLKIDFEGIGTRYVNLRTFPLLGMRAKRLLTEPDFLKSFILVDGVPEWDGQCLFGPEDLLANSTTEFNVG